MSKLYFITWEGDLTQFLAEGETKEEAVKYAIEANKEIGPIWDHDAEEDNYKDIEDASSYEVEDVDFELLRNLAKRTDYMFSMEHVICYNG